MLLRRASNEKSLAKKLFFYQEGVRLRRYERKYCGKFDMNVTCSEVDAERLIEIAPDTKAQSIPNGVDTDYFSWNNSRPEENRLIFVGTMNWYPNIEAVMYIGEQLWPRLKAIFPDLKMDIIGASPPRKILELSKRLPDFIVHGFVDDVRPFIANATAYLCPIKDGGGTKLKILDAMSMSKAIVAHPIACEGISVADGFDISFAQSDEDFIRKVSDLLKSEPARKLMGENARATVVNRYSYTSIGNQFSGLIEDVVAKKRGYL
jgi:glycosyltransferase involved in cell wall biosynthesis